MKKETIKIILLCILSLFMIACSSTSFTYEYGKKYSTSLIKGKMCFVTSEGQKDFISDLSDIDAKGDIFLWDIKRGQIKNKYIRKGELHMIPNMDKEFEVISRTYDPSDHPITERILSKLLLVKVHAGDSDKTYNCYINIK